MSCSSTCVTSLPRAEIIPSPCLSAMEMHPLNTVLLSLRVSAPQHGTCCASRGFDLGFCCCFWPGDGELCPACVQRAERGLDTLYPLPCPWCLSGPSPCRVSLRMPGCAGNLQTGFCTTQSLPGGHSWFFSTFLSPVLEQREHPGPSA